MNVSEQQGLAGAPSQNRIAQLNDTFRKTGRGWQLVVTRGVTALKGFNVLELTSALARFDSFDEHNDPHAEHDFGDLDLWGAELLWKIDYYDDQMTNVSAGPPNESVTTRVLTVMLAEEY